MVEVGYIHATSLCFLCLVSHHPSFHQPNPDCHPPPSGPPPGHHIQMFNCSAMSTASWTKMTQQPFRLESKSNNAGASVCLQSFKDSRFTIGAKLIHRLSFFLIFWCFSSFRLRVIKAGLILDETTSHSHSQHIKHVIRCVCVILHLCWRCVYFLFSPTVSLFSHPSCDTW